MTQLPSLQEIENMITQKEKELKALFELRREIINRGNLNKKEDSFHKNTRGL